MGHKVEGQWPTKGQATLIPLAYEDWMPAQGLPLFWTGGLL